MNKWFRFRWVFQNQLGADNGQFMTITIGNLEVSTGNTALLSDIHGIAVISQASASQAITQIDEALTDLATRRADMGSYMNNLDIP